MTHDLTDRQFRRQLADRYLDGESSLEEEQTLADYYRTASAIDDDECGVATIVLSLAGKDATPCEAPSMDKVAEFDRLLSEAEARPVVVPMKSRKIFKISSAAAIAAAAAVLAFVFLRPMKTEKIAPLASVTPQQETPQPASPASTDVTPMKSEILTTAPPKQTVAVRRHHTAAVPQTKPAETRVGLSDVLELACSSVVNATIERKGNAFIVTACDDAAAVHTYIVDVAGDSAYVVCAQADR